MAAYFSFKAGKNTMVISWNKITFKPALTRFDVTHCFQGLPSFVAFMFCSFMHGTLKTQSPSTSKGSHSTSFISCWGANAFLEVKVEH